MISKKKAKKEENIIIHEAVLLNKYYTIQIKIG